MDRTYVMSTDFKDLPDVQLLMQVTIHSWLYYVAHNHHTLHRGC